MTPRQSNRFDTAHLQDDLKAHTIRGGISTFGAQGFGFFLNIASTATLARLLTPHDYGLVAMVTAVTGLLAIFKDAGLSMATVQQETVTHEQVSTLFWVNVGLSMVLMLIVVGLSPLIVAFYHEPQLQAITLAIAAMFIFDGLAAQHQALLRRQMQFGTLAKIQIVATAVGVAAAIISAMMELGYWALILQMAVGQVLNVALTWAYMRWMPGRPQLAIGTGNMLKFGGYLTAFSFVNYFARNADNVLIGNAWGSNALGLYTKAYGLLLMPLQQINGPITAVAIPALSRLQNDPEQFRAFFIKVLGIICFVTFPLIAWMIVCRKEIILLFLGPQWDGAIPIFAVLALSAFFQPIGNITGTLYIALGRTKRMFKWGLMSSIVIVIGFLVGLPYGAIGVAWAYSGSIALIIYPLIHYALSGTCIEVKDFFIAMKHPFFATATSVSIGIFFHKLIDKYESLSLNLVATSAFMLLSYLIILYYQDRKFIGLALSVITNRNKINEQSNSKQYLC